MKTKQSNNSVATTDAVKIASQRALFNLEWENDTVFKKRELNYKTKAAFQKDLEAGKISKYTTVFIKDSKEIYKNGQYYGSSEGGSLSGLDEIILSQDIISGSTDRGNFTETEYNKILAASEKGYIMVADPDGMKYLSRVSKDPSSESRMHLDLLMEELNILLTNSITIEDKSKNYAFVSIKYETVMYNPYDGHMVIGVFSNTKEAEIELIVNGAGTKFLSDDGQYKTIETIGSAVGKIDSNSDGTGEIFNNYEGKDLNISKGNSSHAEGRKTQANSNGSHAEGIETIAGDSSDPKNGKGAHAEGQVTTALGNGSHAEGYNTKALKDRSHAEGYGTKADNQQAHAEGYCTTATGINSHIEGKSTIQAPEDITEITDVDTIIEKWDKSTLVHDNKFSLSHGQFSHGEGYDVLALGNYSHAEGSLNIAKGECSHAEGFFNEASGMNSHAEGGQNQASGVNAHAEGSKNVASNTNSHAEGQGTIASGEYSHAEGIKTQATGDGSHAEGDNCIAMGINSHVEGNNSLSGGNNSHIEGGQEEFTQLSVTFSKQGDGNFYYVDKSINSAFKSGGILYNLLNIKSIEGKFIIQTDKEIQTLDKEIQITLYKHYAGSKYSHVEGFESITYNELSTNYAKGDCIANHAEGYRTKSYGRFGSHSEGNTTVASGQSSHSEGEKTIASGYCSHAEGQLSKSIGDQSHAEGYQTLAIGNYAHAEGGGAVEVNEAFYTKTNDEIIAEWERLYKTPTGDGFSMAKGKGSHSEGKNTLALADFSHTSGEATVAKSYCQTVIGRFNKPATTEYDNFSISNEAFVIGNGTDINSKGNAFKVLFNGRTYADGAYSGSGADYAEFFEWKDGNELNEDRVGLFVSIENDKIVKATKDSKYILGIVSGNPSVIGDNPMRWKNKYLTDKFGRPIYEEVEVKRHEKKINDNGEEEIVEIIEKQKIFKINSEWDSSKEYTSRESRKEWSAIGLMGKLIVRHDGTLKQGGFCYPSENGIATNSEAGYYVMKVYEDTALIMFK